MTNDACMAELDARIARYRAIPGLAARAAPVAAVAVRADVVRQIAAGVDPDGRPWPATAAGAPALVGAARALTVAAAGAAVVARLEGVEARHDVGRVRGGKVRRILPVGDPPAGWLRAVDDACGREFVRTVEGR